MEQKNIAHIQQGSENRTEFLGIFFSVMRNLVQIQRVWNEIFGVRRGI